MGTATRVLLKRDGAAVVSMALALLVAPLLGRTASPIALFAVVAIAAWHFGALEGLVGAGLSALAIRYFLMDPVHSLTLTFAHVSRLAGFLILSCLLVGLLARLSKAERTWRKAEAWSRLLVQTMQEGIWVCDAEGRTTYVNGRMADMLGYSAAELLGQPIKDLVVDANRAQAMLDASHRSAGVTVHQDFGFRRSDGSKVIAIVTAQPSPTADGSPGGMLAMVDDVTERKRSEQERDRALQAMNSCMAQHGRLVESNIIGIVTAELSGDVDEANDAFLRMIGFTRDDMAHGLVVWSNLTPAEHLAAEQQSVKELWELGACTPYERELIRKDDGRIPVLIGKAALGRYPRSWIGFVLDLTERKRAEQALTEAKEAAEAASRAKDQFLAVLSHELRTPLTPVLAAATALLDDPSTPSEFVPILELTRRNIELEARLIDDLLDINRITRGKIQLDRQLVDAHSLIERSLDICRDDIVAGHLKLDLDLSAAEHHVLGDPARLQQILWNLIKNAVKFTPSEGRLSIRSRNVDAPDETSTCRLLVEVSDTGIGIEPELLSKVFHAFEQGEHVITRQFGGLGLGLAISQSLAKMHRARLTAASAGKGQGATFTLDLETSPRPVGVAPATAPSDRFALSSSVRILLVEDNADTLNVLARLLRRHGYRVTTASSVSAALDATSSEDYDVVISDLGLPDGSGLDVMRNIQNQGSTKGIALSGYGMDDDKLRSQQAGFVAHLTKPVDFQKLEEMIQKVVARHERDDLAHWSEIGGH